MVWLASTKLRLSLNRSSDAAHFFSWQPTKPSFSSSDAAHFFSWQPTKPSFSSSDAAHFFSWQPTKPSFSSSDAAHFSGWQPTKPLSSEPLFSAPSSVLLLSSRSPSETGLTTRLVVLFTASILFGIGPESMIMILLVIVIDRPELNSPKKKPHH